MNTAVTTPFGADFDGDEMNIFYQDSYDITRIEQDRMSVKNCPVYPIQDTITTLYKMTKYPQPIDRCFFYDCCMECNRYDIPYEHDMTTADLVKLVLQPGMSYNEVLDKSMIKSLSRDIDTIHKMQLIVHRWNTSYDTLTVGYSVDDDMLNMIDSGSKGNAYNYRQITECVGEQYVKNKSVGYCYSSYNEGLDVNEYFVHQMGGREGIIHTNISTANIGYASRKVCKAMSSVVLDDRGRVVDVGRIISEVF
jgi:DNA-directed RNA polymerase beta' subunit